MADRNLAKIRYIVVEVLQVLEAQVMAGIYTQAQLVRMLGSLGKGGYGGCGVLRILCRIRLGI